MVPIRELDKTYESMCKETFLGRPCARSEEGFASIHEWPRRVVFSETKAHLRGWFYNSRLHLAEEMVEEESA